MKATRAPMEAPALTPQQMIRRRGNGGPVLPHEARQQRRHVISVLIENSIGALNRVLNLFSARSFTLESVAVGTTDDPSVARVTLVTSGDERLIAQVNRHLERLLDVLQTEDLTETDHVAREICLVKVAYGPAGRAELLGTLEVFRGRVVDVTTATMTFELTGPAAKIDAFINLVRPNGILEIARSGRIVMRRAEQIPSTEPQQETAAPDPQQP